MKKFSAVTLALVLVLAFSSVTFAQGGNLPGSGWWTGEQVMNIGTADATIAVTAYDKSDPSKTYSSSKTVAQGAAYTFTPNDFANMSAGFQGSAVVSSDQPIKAIVNVANRPVGSMGVPGGKAAGQYQGIDSSQLGQTVYFPLAKGNHYNKSTTFFIQNAGTAATTVTGKFIMLSGAEWNYTSPAPVQPNMMVAFSVLDVNGYDPAAANANAKVGSLTVTGTQPLAGVVLEHFTAEAPATILQATRGFTAADMDSVGYAPNIKHNWYGRFTGIQVQNVSDGAIDIKVTYTPTGGTACLAAGTKTETKTAVAKGASVTFIQLEGSNTPLASGCLATAKIEGIGTNAKILGVVNESYRSDSIPATGQRSATSSVIAGKSTTHNISVPLFKDDSYSKRTGLQIMNVSASPTSNIVATFTCRTDGGSTFTAISKPQTAPAGGAVLFYHPSTQGSMFTAANPFSVDKATCAVAVTADQNIVAIAAEAVSPVPGNTLEQDNSIYEGFNLP